VSELPVFDGSSFDQMPHQPYQALRREEDGFMTGRWRSGLMALVMAWVGLAACTTIDVKTDFDHTADFGKFQTFAFVGMTDLNQGGVLSNSLTRTRIENAIDEELTRKGLRQIELDQNPDLWVHYWVGVEDKQRIQTIGPSVGVARWHGWYGWGAGHGGVSTYEYRQGTLITDLIEPAKNELVWRATMMAHLKETPQKNAELIKQAVEKAFKNYPPAQSAR
jgi:hypothetical protein